MPTLIVNHKIPVNANDRVGYMKPAPVNNQQKSSTNFVPSNASISNPNINRQQCPAQWRKN